MLQMQMMPTRSRFETKRAWLFLGYFLTKVYHTHAHTHTHTHTHAHTHTHTHTHKHTHTHTYTHTLTHTHSFSCCNFLCVVLAAVAYLKYRRCRLSCLPFVWHFFFIVTHTHTRTHTHTQMYARTHTHTCKYTNKYTHIHTRSTVLKTEPTVLWDKERCSNFVVFAYSSLAVGIRKSKSILVF